MAQRSSETSWRVQRREMGRYERQTMKTIYAIAGISCAIIPAAAAIIGGGNPCLIAGFTLTLLGGGGVGWLLNECASRADVATSPALPIAETSLHHSPHKRSPRAGSKSTLLQVRGGLPA